MVARSNKNGVKITTDNHSLDRYVLKKVGYFKEIHKGDVYREVLGDGTKIEIKQAGPNNINCTVVSPTIEVEEEEEEEEIPTYKQPGLCYAYLSEHDANSWERKYKFRIYSQSQGKFIDQVMNIPTEKSLLYDFHHAIIQRITYPSLEDNDNHFVINTTTSHQFSAPWDGMSAADNQMYVGLTRIFENSALTKIDYGSAIFPPWLYKPNTNGKNLKGILVSYDLSSSRLKVWDFNISAYPEVQQYDYENFVTMTDSESIQEIANLRIAADMTTNPHPLASNLDTPEFSITGSWVTKDGSAMYIKAATGRQSQKILDLANESGSDDLFPDVHGFMRAPELFKLSIVETDTPEGIQYTATLEYIPYDRSTSLDDDYQIIEPFTYYAKKHNDTIGSGPCEDCQTGGNATGTHTQNSFTYFKQASTATCSTSYEYLHDFLPDKNGEPVPVYTHVSGETSIAVNGISDIASYGNWTLTCGGDTYTPVDVHNYDDNSSTLNSLVKCVWSAGIYNYTSTVQHRSTSDEHKSGNIVQSLNSTSYENVHCILPLWIDLANGLSCVEEHTLHQVNSTNAGNRMEARSPSGLYFDAIELYPLDPYYTTRVPSYYPESITFPAYISAIPAKPFTDKALIGESNYTNMQYCEGVGGTWTYANDWTTEGTDSPVLGEEQWNMQWYYAPTGEWEWLDKETYGPATNIVLNRYKPWVSADVFSFYANIDYANWEGDYLARFRYTARDGGIFLNDEKDSLMCNKKIIPDGDTELNVHPLDEITAIFII